MHDNIYITVAFAVVIILILTAAIVAFCQGAIWVGVLLAVLSFIPIGGLIIHLQDNGPKN